ncbi:MAG: HupE/UreJ family protein [Pseudomonadota bacterium]|nr:HupE/UreJ family protein [Pseudomonadota bacterium]
MLQAVIFLPALLFPAAAPADVVKPALVEISVYKRGVVEIELRASIEALLTGINSQFKNTQDSPAGGAYDELRVLPPQELQEKFEPFQPEMLRRIRLEFNGRPAALRINSLKIPEAGYTKVPRISVINLTAETPAGATELTWYYPVLFSDNAVRVRQVDEASQQWHWSEWQWIREDQASRPFSLQEVYAQRSVWKVVLDYMVIGFEHIVPKGKDHILFILGIFLFSTRLKPLLWQVTMFTLAHTLTLGLSAAGIVELPPRIVEPLIALSIAWIGIENIWAKSLHKQRLALVFCFGLLHGLGFASVLADFGMPRDAFFTALISFNIGVEFGQLAVILAAYLVVGLWFGDKPWYRKAIVVPGSLTIAVIGLWWTVARIAG